MSSKLRDSVWDRHGVVNRMLRDVPLPRLARVRQVFDRERIHDIAHTVTQQLSRPEIARTVNPGASIAVTVGSRGIANLSTIVREIVRNLQALGAKPFIVPAMGSHGGATAEGQRELLASLGITEESTGAAIHSSMEVVQISTGVDRHATFIDRIAFQADGIVVVGRVKPHTAYRGQYESGLFKMLAIGLGKHRGAEACHDQGFGSMEANVVRAAQSILKEGSVLFGVALIENAYHETCKIIALERDQIETQEPALLEEAKGRMAQIHLKEFDVLIVNEIGKNYSGDGMDPNVTGSYSTPYASGGPAVQHYVVLDVSRESHGNAVGVGRADYTTKRLFDKADFDAMYANALTAKVALGAKCPMVLGSDRLAIQAAIKTCETSAREGVRVVHIRNSTDVDEIFVSENMVPEVNTHSRMEILEAPKDIRFDANGNLIR